MSEMKIVIAGAAGRMGRMLVRVLADHPAARLSGALEQPGSPALGQDAGLLAETGASGVLVGDDFEAALAGADGILDFTAPAATLRFARLAAERGPSTWSARPAFSRPISRRCGAAPTGPASSSPETCRSV
jgi:4-hydroxy-tetrahydrodipicolinate reductase